MPEDVQTWKTPCDNADILVFATHADDEILFLEEVIVIVSPDENVVFVL